MKTVRLSEKDASRIIGLDKLAFGDSYDLPAITEKEVKKVLRNGFILGISDGTELVSIIQVLEKEKNEYYVYGIATNPEKQGTGLADGLLKQAIKTVKEKNGRKITATIKPENAKSIGLFEKNGFKIIKLVPDYYGKGKDRLIAEITFP